MKEILNPFVISEKIIPKYFCDRKEESATLINLLQNGNNVVLLSRRRIGKTGLIQYCFDRKQIKNDYFIVYIDILSTSNLQEFTFLLGKEIVSLVKSLGKKALDSFINIVKSLTVRMGYDGVAGLPSLNFQLGDIIHPEYTLKEIFHYLDIADRPCLIAIDEFQQVAKYPEKGVEALIRSHILQVNNCRFIFSGSEHHLLSQMFLSPSRPFYNSSSLLELRVIPKDIYVSFIIDMFKKKHKKISKTLAEQIYDTFDGLTFYVQRICNGVFEKTPIESEATESMLDEVIDMAVYSYDTLFRERLYRLTTRQKELLFAIASEREADKLTSAEFIKKHSLGSVSTVQTSLKALLKMEIVERELSKVFIPEKFFAMWVRKNYC